MPNEQAKYMKTGILFPHQLFEQTTLTSTCDTIYLLEEGLGVVKSYPNKKRTFLMSSQNSG